MEVLQRTANRGSISTGEYEIANSIKIEPANDEGLYFTPSSTTNTDTFTFSCWFKRTEISNQINTLFGSYTDASNHALFRFKTDDTLELRFVTTGTGKILVSNMVFRDTSAWYHMVLAVDTTDGTTANRVKVYINGEQITLTGDYPNQNQDCIGINTASKAMNVGYLSNVSNLEFAGYIAEAHHIDGSQLASTDFGQYDGDSGIWKPKAYTGSYGTNGFYLDFEDNTSAGKDTSGNNNNFSDANLNAADHATDTPTNNFCTINALVDNNFSIWALTEGGTRGPNTGENNASVGTFAVSSGKWYWEGVTTSFSGTNYWKWGVIRADVQQGNSADPASDAGSSWYTGDNAFYTQTSTTASSVAYNTGFTGYTAGDIWSISLNCDVSPYEMTIRINNSVPGTSANNTDRSVGTFASSDSVVPFYMLANSASDNTWHNFGNPFISNLSGGNSDANGYGDFKYAPPSGYYALCTKNLAEYG
jgi:hypothetical protein